MIWVFIITLLIAIITGAAASIAANEIIWDNSKTGFNKLNTRGRLFILFMLMLVFLPAVQFYFQSKIDEEKDRARKNDERILYDSVNKSFNSSVLEMQKRFDKSSVNMQASFDNSSAKTVEILAKYGFKLDTTNNRLSKIKMGDDPVLNIANSNNPKGLAYINHINGEYNYKITSLSEDAGSSRFNIKASYVVADIFRGYQYVTLDFTAPILDSSIVLSRGKSASTDLQIGDSKFTYDTLYMWVRGNYMNTDGTKSFPINIVVFNVKSDNACGGITGPTRKKVILIVQKNEEK